MNNILGVKTLILVPNTHYQKFCAYGRIHSSQIFTYRFEDLYALIARAGDMMSRLIFIAGHNLLEIEVSIISTISLLNTSSLV